MRKALKWTTSLSTGIIDCDYKPIRVARVARHSNVLSMLSFLVTIPIRGHEYPYSSIALSRFLRSIFPTNLPEFLLYECTSTAQTVLLEPQLKVHPLCYRHLPAASIATTPYQSHPSRSIHIADITRSRCSYPLSLPSLTSHPLQMLCSFLPN